MDPKLSAGTSHTAKVIRVKQACARCRNKKIKCDGKTPICSTCHAENAECVYGQIRKRGKGKTRGYIQSLEQRLERMESMLQKPPTQGAPEPSGVRTSTSLSKDNSPTASHDSQPRSSNNTTPNSAAEPYQVGTLKAALPPWPDTFPRAPLTHGIMKQLRDATRSNGSNVRQLFINLLPKHHALVLLEKYLEVVNPEYPLFQRESLLSACRNDYPTDEATADPAWWISLNAIIGMGSQLKATNDAFKAMSDLSWGYVKNGFSSYAEVITSEPSVSGVQAVLTMALFMNGTADSRTTSLLTSSAIRMLQMIGLQSEEYNSGLDTDEAEDRRRLFWIAYLLDATTSMNNDTAPMLNEGDYHLELPSEKLSHVLSASNSAAEVESVQTLRRRIELTEVASKIRRRLFNLKGGLCFSPQLWSEILIFHDELDVWKESLQYILGCHHVDLHAKPEEIALSRLMLALTYCNAVDVLYCVALKYGELQQIPSEATQSLIQGLSERRLDVARGIFGMLKFTRVYPLPLFWRAMSYYLYASIALLADILEHPDGAYATADLGLITSLVLFLDTMKKEEGMDLCRFRTGVDFLKQVAVHVVSQAHSDSINIDESGHHADPSHCPCYQDLRETLSEPSSHMRLTQGLMGNVPRLTTEASSVFHEVVKILGHNKSSFGLLTPDTLMPSTYGFGSSPERAKTASPSSTIT